MLAPLRPPKQEWQGQQQSRLPHADGFPTDAYLITAGVTSLGHFPIVGRLIRLENFRFPAHIREMGDADGGFIVLVLITLGDGLPPYRDVYLVGCSTGEEAKARIKYIYPSEPNIELYVSPLRIVDTNALKLAQNEVREWHDLQCSRDSNQLAKS